MTGGFSAAVVTFRRGQSLLGVIESLAIQTHRPAFVVVADNDPDRSAEAVVAAAATKWGDLPLLYVAVGENLGPAGGWARAAQEAATRSDRGEWLLVLDDDDPLGDSELLARMIATTEIARDGDRWGALGLRGARFGRRSARLRRVEGEEGLPLRVDYLASGGAPLYRWAAIDQVGFFDPGLFFGFEDLDQGLRLTAAGWEVWAVSFPSLHTVAESSTERVEWREYFKSRALISIMRSRVGRWAVLVSIARSTAVGSVSISMRRGGWRLGLARVSGTRDALLGRMGPNHRAPSSNAPKSSGSSRDR